MSKYVCDYFVALRENPYSQGHGNPSTPVPCVSRLPYMIRVNPIVSMSMSCALHESTKDNIVTSHLTRSMWQLLTTILVTIQLTLYKYSVIVFCFYPIVCPDQFNSLSNIFFAKWYLNMIKYQKWSIVVYFSVMSLLKAKCYWQNMKIFYKKNAGAKVLMQSK